MKINTEISVGELLDKISILKIKSLKIKDEKKLKNINKELAALNIIVDQSLGSYKALGKRSNELMEVNLKLWSIEDEIREKERNKSFDKSFIELARSVYVTNDKRFDIKNKINKESGSSFSEEKSYEQY
jgi:predicted nuclease with TOPRIM domain